MNPDLFVTMVDAVLNRSGRRTGFRRAVAVLGAGAMIAVVVPIASVSSTVPVVPADKVLPTGLDLVQQYQGQSICDPADKPGIAKLRALLRRTYGNHAMYTTRSCSSDPSSEHTEGRALDWMVSMKRPAERAKATAFLNWLLAPGPAGEPAEMARRLGIMYIGWNDRIWRSYRGPGWGELKGCFSKTSTSWDTYCHRDHIHFSLTWDGAAGQTSYWSGKPQQTPACPSRTVSGRLAPMRRPAKWVQLARPKVVVDTRRGVGLGRRACRIQQQRWSGDSQVLTVPLTSGRARVPTVASRVKLRVSTIQANAPAAVFAWPSGASRGQPVLTATMNGIKRSIINRRVGAGGTVALATGTGDVPVRVELVGYQIPR